MDVQNVVINCGFAQEIANMNIIGSNYIAKDGKITQEDIDWADMYIGFTVNPTLDLSGLKWVHSLAAGIERFLRNPTIGSCELFTRTTGVFGQLMSEYALFRILYDTQKFEAFNTLQENKDWANVVPTPLYDINVLLCGTGSIGSDIAEKFSALEMNVYGYSKSGRQKDNFIKVYKSDEDINVDIDYIVSTLPSTDDTYKIFNMEFFDRFTGAGFINMGRGSCVDEDMLILAVANGNISKAYLDVTAMEPLPKESLLWTTKNIYITPHISARTNARMGLECLKNTIYKQDNSIELDNIVNIERQY